MAQVRYTSYRFQAPPLMEKDFFDYLKELPVKEGCIRYHPYDGFIKTFPGWCIFFLLLVGLCAYMYFQGEKDYLVPLVGWPALALLSGGLHSMFSWLGYYMDCRSYFDTYSAHINQAKDYDALLKLRNGLHAQPADPLHDLFPGMFPRNPTKKRNAQPPRDPWIPL
jgi:hypothetical protein